MAYFCKSIAIEMGGVSRYFSKVSGSGVDVTLLNIAMLIIDFVGVVRGLCSLNNPPLCEALQGKLPLRGVLRGLKQTAGVSLRVLRGGSAGAHGNFRGVATLP